MHLYLWVSSCFTHRVSYPNRTLTAQVVSQRGSTETRVAGVVAEGLVAGSLVGDDKFSRFDSHWTDENGQQGYSDHQQDDKGGAGVDVGADQTHNQTQQEDHRRVQHRVPVTLRKHSNPPRHRWL